MPDKVRPITPGRVVKEKKKNFPNEVLEAFNELIAEKWNGTSATILQKDVEALMLEKGLSVKDIYDKNWMDVEAIYRSAGWSVEYDRPGFNESFCDPRFVFRKRR